MLAFLSWRSIECLRIEHVFSPFSSIYYVLFRKLYVPRFNKIILSLPSFSLSHLLKRNQYHRSKYRYYGTVVLASLYKEQNFSYTRINISRNASAKKKKNKIKFLWSFIFPPRFPTWKRTVWTLNGVVPQLEPFSSTARSPTRAISINMRTVRIREYENKNPLVCEWNQQPRRQRGASKGGEEEECSLKRGTLIKSI